MKLLPKSPIQTLVITPSKITSAAPDSSQKHRNYHYWTLEDDEKLSKLAKDLNYDWRKVGLHFPSRNIPEIEQRWRQRIDPTTKKTSWSKEEDLILQEMHKKFGGKWKTISNYLPGRLPSTIKNRFYGKIFKLPKVDKVEKKEDKEIFSETQDFIEDFLDLSDEELSKCLN